MPCFLPLPYSLTVHILGLGEPLCLAKLRLFVCFPPLTLLYFGALENQNWEGSWLWFSFPLFREGKWLIQKHTGDQTRPFIELPHGFCFMFLVVNSHSLAPCDLTSDFGISARSTVFQNKRGKCVYMYTLSYISEDKSPGSPLWVLYPQSNPTFRGLLAIASFPSYCWFYLR